MLRRVNLLLQHVLRPRLYNFHNTRASLNPLITTMTTESGTRLIHTAGIVVIGDEVLGGKTVDTNSAYFAKFCFSLGIALKRIEVIADDANEIAEATRRMSMKYDFVVTSGGIGPTHDDITYQSIADAFGLPLRLHAEAFEKMKLLSKPHPSQPGFQWEVPSAALTAKKRMVELPMDVAKPMEDQAVLVDPSLWVPVSIVNENIHILPGVPKLFERMLEGLKPKLLPRLVDPEGKGAHRILFSTPLAESEIAEYLTMLASKVQPMGVKVGSYPRWEKERNTVTLVGRDLPFMESLIPEMESSLRGKRVYSEDEDDPITNGPETLQS